MPYPKGTTPKPTALTDEVKSKLIRYISKGHYLEPACALAGITREAFAYWQKLHEQGHKSAKVHADFFTSLARAYATAEDNAIDALNSGRQGWQASAWLIERRFRSRWGRDKAMLQDEALDDAAVADADGNQLEP